MLKDEINKNSVKQMLAYGSADMYLYGSYFVISSYFLVFLTLVQGINPAYAGLAIMIGKIWDAISDPLMAIIYERTKTKHGKSRPYFLFGAIPAFISFALLWWAPSYVSTDMGKLIYFTIAYILYSTCYTVISIPYESLLPRMIDDYSIRTNYVSVRSIFGAIAGVLSTGVYELVIYWQARGESLTLTAALKPNFIIMGIILGTLYAIPLLISFMGTKEKLSLNIANKVSVKEVLKEYKQVLSSACYRRYLIILILCAFTWGLYSTGMIFFAYVILPTDSFLLGISVVTLIITIKGITEMGFFPINVYLMKKYVKQKPYIIDIPLLIIASLIALFIPMNANPLYFLISIAFVGAGSSCLGIVTSNLLADLPDIDELIYGKRREGFAMGLSTFAKKSVGGITIFFVGVILAKSGLDQSDPENAVRTVSAMWGVKLVYSILPPFICLAIIILGRAYKLDGNKHKIIKDIIARRKINGYVNLTEEELNICEDISGKKYLNLWISSIEDISPQKENE